MSNDVQGNASFDRNGDTECGQKSALKIQDNKSSSYGKFITLLFVLVSVVGTIFFLSGSVIHKEASNKSDRILSIPNESNGLHLNREELNKLPSVRRILKATKDVRDGPSEDLDATSQDLDASSDNLDATTKKALNALNVDIKPNGASPSGVPTKKSKPQPNSKAMPTHQKGKMKPKGMPTDKPIMKGRPTMNPVKPPNTYKPIAKPTYKPFVKPTYKPFVEPTPLPTKTPTETPTASPTETPTAVPTARPTVKPTKTPTVKPTKTPTKTPTASPTETPTTSPTETPTAVPTARPTVKPTSKPSIPAACEPSSNDMVVYVGNHNYGSDGDGGSRLLARIAEPSGVSVDDAGNLYFTTIGSSMSFIRKVDRKTGIITTIAGTGTTGPDGNTYLATAAQLSNPTDVAIFKGYVFIADMDNDVIRIIDLDGIINVVAGTGYKCSPKLHDTMLSTCLDRPYGIVIDSNGMIYFSDSMNNVIRKIDTSVGDFHTKSGRAQWTISTIVGTGSSGAGSTTALGDGGPASAAQLNLPLHLALSHKEQLYIVDSGNYKVRVVDLRDMTISTAVGNGVEASDTYSPAPGELAINTNMHSAVGVAVDKCGNIFVSDKWTCTVSKVTVGTGVITTYLGTPGSYMDPTPKSATRADSKFREPKGLAILHDGTLYIADKSDVVYSVEGDAGEVVYSDD